VRAGFLISFHTLWQVSSGISNESVRALGWKRLCCRSDGLEPSDGQISGQKRSAPPPHAAMSQPQSPRRREMDVMKL
jgi:hypothetical protein